MIIGFSVLNKKIITIIDKVISVIIIIISTLITDEQGSSQKLSNEKKAKPEKKENKFKHHFSKLRHSVKEKFTPKKEKKIIKPDQFFYSSDFDIFVNMVNVSTRVEEHDRDPMVRKNFIT